MNKRLLLVISLLMFSGCKSNISSISNEISSLEALSSKEEFNPYFYLKESNFKGLESKIKEKEDFIFVISSKICAWCQKQEDEIFEYMHLAPVEINYYYIDELFDDLEVNNNNEPINGIDKYNSAKEEYRYFASNIEKIGDYILGGEGKYIENNYTERFGIKEPSIIYPTTFIYIDGVLNIENSKLGHGWTMNEDSFIEYINTINSLRN